MDADLTSKLTRAALKHYVALKGLSMLSGVGTYPGPLTSLTEAGDIES